MEKAQIQSLITNQVKIIYSLLSAFGLFIIAVLDLYEEKYHFAIIAAAFAFLLVVYATYLLVFKPEKESSYPEWGLVSLLLAFTLFGMQESEQVKSEEHTSELQSRPHLVCRLLLEKK